MSNLFVLLTGANAGIGYHVAHQLAKITGDVTYTTIVGARSIEKANATVQQLVKDDSSLSPDKFYALAIDLDSDESIASAAKNVEAKFGYLDILINNAAIVGTQDVSERQQYLDAFNTNVVGTVMVTKAFLPLLKKSKAPAVPGTRIVTVSSSLSSLAMIAKGRPITPQYAAYSTSKTALNSTSLYAWRTLKDAGDKIAVVTICPGFTSTKLNNFIGTKTPEDSAASIVKAATVGSWEEVNGKFLNDADEELPW
jgi:NAD(P)-dependent dehydrogenase (short-subunit alcohol dehydrogenase family)